MTSDSDFPSTCDVLCLGTGLVESIVGAACSRIGKKVVVLDRNAYYGGDWATFNIKGLQEWFANYLAGDEKLIGYKDFNEGLQPEELLLDIPTLHSRSITHALLCDYTNNVDVGGKASTENTCSGSNVPTSLEEAAEVEAVVAAAAEDDSSGEAVVEAKLQLVTNFRNSGRRFNIGLCSKILLARGKMVRLLVDSATSRYCEFLAVNDINFFDAGRLQKVPSCRADVFKNSLITLPEKRQMMRLLEFCFDENNLPSQAESEQCFVEYLTGMHAISDRLAHIITQHILYQSSHSKTSVCFSKLRLFCQSLGVYSNSPYLWTMYGVGELPQCFSRLNAIFGGIFILGAPREVPLKVVVHAKEDGDEVKDDSQSKSTRVNGVLLASGQRVACDYLVAETSYVPTSVLPAFEEAPAKTFLRGIFITSQRLEATRESSVSLISIPPPDGRRYPLRLVEEAPSSSSGPHPFCILQATVEDEDENMDPKSQMDLYLDKVLQPFSIKSNSGGDERSVEKPEVMLALYFRCTYRPTRLHAKTSSEDSFLNNLFMCSGPDPELDFDACVLQAEQIFKRMYPTEEFLPRAPDPSDVIIGGETFTESGGQELEEEGGKQAVVTAAAEESETSSQSEATGINPSESCEQAVLQNGDDGSKETFYGNQVEKKPEEGDAVEVVDQTSLVQ